MDCGGDSEVSCEAIHDISLGGIRLALSSQQQPGARIKLCFTLSDSDSTMDLSGQIVWARQVEPFVVGIRFHDMDYGQLHSLESYLNER